MPSLITMTRHTVRSVALVAAVLSASFASPATPAFAAPKSKPQATRPPADPYFDYAGAQPFRWQGFYGGVSLGYGWGATEHSYDRNDNHGTATNDLKGFVGSVTAGYNWLYSPAFLVGIEGDIGLMNLEARDKVIFDGHVWKAQFGPWWGTARARAGVLFGQALFYGTAGLAFMGVDETGYGDAAGQTAWNRSLRTGWVVGAGVEYAIAPSMTAKLEYLHMDFGTYDGLSENQENYTFRNRADIVRAGLNFRF